MRKILIYLSFPILLFASCSTVNKSSAKSDIIDAPNILFILADDMGLDISPGYPQFGKIKPKTPILDGLIKNGQVYNNVWSNPVCSPTRATILTGKYAIRTGVGTIIKAGEINKKKSKSGLDPSELSIHKYISENSPSTYSTALIGKWHLFPEQKDGSIENPEIMGIDYYSGLIIGRHNDYYSWRNYKDGRERIVNKYSTTNFTDQSIRWIKKQKNPWFLWLAYTAPHGPYHLPPAKLHHNPDLSVEKYEIHNHTQLYFISMIEAMDTEIGRLIDNIPKEMRDNTIIVFLGDNGTSKDVIQKPYSENHAKGTLFEGGIHVPMIIAGNKVANKGSVKNELINTTDLFTTFAELAGIQQGDVFDSHSFAPLITGEKIKQFVPREYAYSEYFSVPKINSHGWTIRNQDYKFINLVNGTKYFFKLKNDEGESNNLIDKMTDFQKKEYDKLIKKAASIRSKKKNPQG